MISISWGAGHFMLHDIPHAPRLFEARSRPLACALSSAPRPLRVRLTHMLSHAPIRGGAGRGAVGLPGVLVPQPASERELCRVSHAQAR